MDRSLSLLSALALGSTALVIAHGPKADAMAIAFDCFDRNTSQLVARSAVDMTSPAISCLPVPGGAIASNPGLSTADDVMKISDTTTDDPDADFFEDPTVDDSTAEDFSDDDFNNDNTEGDIADLEDSQSTGEKVGSAFGEHLGKLLVKGLSDLFR